MTKIRKVKVRDHEILDLDVYFNGITVDESYRRLKEKEQQLLDIGYENIVIDREYNYDIDREYNYEETNVIIQFDRPETSVEFNRRIKALEKKKEAAKRKLEKDRKLYEKLKKQFEDKE